MEEVTIAIPTFFAGRMLANCVESILNVVESPCIFVYKNSVGWLQACNEILRRINGDIILANDDIIMLSDCAKQMRSLAYSDDKIGIVGGKALAPDQQTIINYGIHIGVDGNSAHKHFGRPRNSVKVESQKAVEGSLMYIKRALIDGIGGFDEKYTNGYRAEVAYAFTAREKGWKVMSCPTAEYIHLISQTMSKLGIVNDSYDIFQADWGRKLKLGLI